MNIAAAWPYVLAIAPVVVGSAAFAKTLLEIRKLQIEIRKLEGDDSKQRLLETEQKVAQSTGRVRRFVFVFLIVSLAAALSITAFLRGQSIGIAKERAKEEADAKRVEAEKSRLFEESRQADEKRQLQLNELLARVTELTAKASTPETKKDAETLKTEIKDVVSLVKVVSIHVGGDDHKEGNFAYTAPAGYIIKSFRMIERAKGGDAQYHPQLVSSSQLEVRLER